MQMLCKIIEMASFVSQGVTTAEDVKNAQTKHCGLLA
jgi:hypothetical protein